jgi:DNA-binding CsgD family transcriptional regulator/tetratricopeptide (TPR) repeat protein
VAARVSSPRLVGREQELDLLVAAFKAAATEERAATFLIGGEAGVGKTRLVAELATRVEESGGMVAIGSCIEMVDRALPFGPVVQALRDVHRHMDPALHAAVVGDAEPALARLLPELDQGGGDAADGGAALFEHLLGTLTRLGDQVPTLFVLEDLHWADHSTRDFLAFLARNLRDARILVVGTFRSDDLHRRHPLRGVLAELERSGAVTRLDIPRLDRDEVAELIAAIRGAPADATLVERTYERSDGNAFFAEELLAAEELCQRTLPDSLRDIVMARIDALPDAAARALRVVAVIGRSADHRLVTAVAELPDDELTEGLRQAIVHQVLVAEPDGLAYRFRHALVHEAVYEDLLPSERVHLHTRIAELLSKQPDWFDGDAHALTSELACHWYSAHDQARALPASLDAARAAEQMYAYPEALAHAERALALWPQVPDASELTGMSHAALLRYAAAQADLAGILDRAIAFVREAIDEVDPERDPVEAGLAHERLGRYLWQTNRPAAEYLPENYEAVRRVPEQPASDERARVLATLGQQLMLAGRNLEAIETCWRAIAVAQEVGARVVEGHARNTLGSSLGAIGRFEAGRAELMHAREIALETSSWIDLARAATNYGANLQMSGRHEEAVEISLAGAEQARRHGLQRACAPFLRLNAAESLYELGRWDEAEEQLREAEVMDPEGPPVDRLRTGQMWALLFASRGRYEDARAQLDVVRSLRGSTSDVFALELDSIEASVRAWSGDRDGAIELALTEARSDQPRNACSDAGLPLLLDATTVAADTQVVSELAEAFERWNAIGRWGGGQPGDYAPARAQLQAEQHRDDPDAWRAVADAWQSGKRLPRVAYARYRQAAAFVAVGDRAAAEPVAQDAYSIATRVGFAWLSEQIAALARRSDLDLGEPLVPTSPAEQVGLTSREREVLQLLAEGRTNRQIGEELFISTKTASVHVSNILAKLQVANRGAAAAAAYRLGLVEERGANRR